MATEDTTGTIHHTSLRCPVIFK